MLLLFFNGGAAPSPSDTGIVSGDGPPWHPTEKERRRLEQYRQELAKLQREFDRRHRQNVQDILDDIKVAIYGEPEPEPEAVRQVEQAIKALPPLNRRSLFAVNLAALKADIEQAQREREAAQDEEDIEVLLGMML